MIDGVSLPSLPNSDSPSGLENSSLGFGSQRLPSTRDHIPIEQFHPIILYRIQQWSWKKKHKYETHSKVLIFKQCLSCKDIFKNLKNSKPSIRLFVVPLFLKLGPNFFLDGKIGNLLSLISWFQFSLLPGLPNRSCFLLLARWTKEK